MKHTKQDPASIIVRDPSCPWCNGTGFTYVPDFDNISHYELYEQVMSGSPPNQAIKLCYCHRCYPEPPIKYGEIRYPNLLDFVDSVARRGISQENDVLLAVLEHGFKVRERSYLAKELIAEVMHKKNF